MTWHPPEELVRLRKETKTGVKTKKRRKTVSWNSRIMHVDMDAFFAAIEQRDNPHLRGRPVIVGGLPGGRGVVATCSYEARKYGVRSGMALVEAEKRCPEAVYLKTNGKKYTSTALKIVEIFHHYTPVVEPVSIDEAYLDITGSIRRFGSDKNLALTLKDEIRTKLRLTCSVGIAHNRIFAKLASGLEKPDGIIIISPEDISKKVYPLPVETLWGIGEKTAKILHEHGVSTIGDLAVHPARRLKKFFGIIGEHLQKVARGESASEVLPIDKRGDEKSIGHEHTFEADVEDNNTPFKMLLKLSQKVGRRVRSRGFGGKTVTLKLRYSNFETHTHRETFPNLIWDDREIYEAGKMLFHQLYEKKRKIRLLGLSVSKLVRINVSSVSSHCQVDLFDEPYRIREILPVMDSLRDKFGERIISRCGANS